MVPSFQEGIVLFGVTLLLQMANYFKGKKVQLRIRIILIIGRMGYLVIFSLSKLFSSLMTHAYCSHYKSHLSLLAKYDYLIFTFLNTIDAITRVFIIFAFMRIL